MVTKYSLFDKLDGQSYHGGERKAGEVIPFSFFALMGRVARASSLEADKFCNGGVIPPQPSMLLCFRLFVSCVT
jgi:hypothetical protein